MADDREASLVAVVLPRPAAAGAITSAWDRGEAVAVLDPDAPPAARERTLRALRPTHVLDAEGMRALPEGVPTADGVRAVVMTSGTAGEPKGVELTQAGSDSVGRGWAAAIDAQPDDRWLVCLPLHHVAGLAILARARVSGAAVTVHPTLDLRAVLDAPRTVRATLLSVVPTMLRRLLDAGGVVGYRAVVVGGASLPVALRARAEAAGIAVVDAYGLSETWGGVVLNGVPLDDTEIALAADGEVLLSGPPVMRGYRLRDEETAAAFTDDGRFRTGDVGAFDDHGRLAIIDRLRDIVITGGVNVSPTEVEQVLVDHAAVADVCVAGAPDEEWGERLVAFVVPLDASSPPTLDELRAFARDRLPAAKLPRELSLIEFVPRTAGGKPIRRSLRAAQ